MAKTYNASLTSAKDQVRFMVGDRDEGSMVLQDEEILYLVGVNTSGSVVNLYGAAASAALAISAEYSKLADKDIEGYKVSYSQKSKNFATLADRLIAAGKDSSSATGGGDAGPSATGISLCDQITSNENPDRREGEIRQGMFDNPPTDTGTHFSRGVIR